MIKVGTVKSLWRYPVKGMAGELVEAAALGPMGIEGDRLMAVQDVARQEIQSCKFRPALLQCRAHTTDSDDGLVITFPDGAALPVDDPLVNESISKLLGHESVLLALRPASDRDFYRRYKVDETTWLDELKETFAREPSEPLPDLDNLPADAQTYVSILGSFFLVSRFHLITTASLKHLSALNTAADWDEARFRPNLVIETSDAFAGLVEQSWLGHTIKIGDVTIACSETAPRCGAVVRKQQNLAQDSSILRTIVREAHQNLGIYADILGQGNIKVGDAVYVSEQPSAGL